MCSSDLLLYLYLLIIALLLILGYTQEDTSQYDYDSCPDVRRVPDLSQKTIASIPIFLSVFVRLNRQYIHAKRKLLR